MSKLLLIDDEKAIVRVLSISLKSDGYDVITAYGGEEGLNMFRRESPDIVLTDIKMPGVDGIEVLKRIKDLDPDTEVIIITGHGDMHLAIEALQLGASDF
ncbi:MAG: response regulator, partial [Syntrophobacterales bacterium]|nr:response regulator [Syntrophobacterales bacterium]